MARVVEVSRAGGPEVLQFVDAVEQVPSAAEVLIDVKAFGLNRAESMWREDVYPERVRSFPVRIGFELAGTVAAGGADVGHVQVGDAVNTLFAFSMNDYGAYGEQVLMPGYAVVKQLRNLTFAEAASVWEMFLTASGMLVDTAGVGENDVVLLTAASSGVALAAIQIARARGATPVALTRTAAKRQRLLDAGASHVIVTEQEDVLASVQRLTRGRGASVALDPVGGALTREVLEALAPGGRLVVYGDLSGEPIPVPALSLVARRIILQGFSLSPTGDYPGFLAANSIEAVRHSLENGSFKPVIDSIVPFESVVEAHRRLDSQDHFGKIIVAVEGANTRSR